MTFTCDLKIDLINFEPPNVKFIFSLEYLKFFLEDIKSFFVDLFVSICTQQHAPQQLEMKRLRF